MKIIVISIGWLCLISVDLMTTGYLAVHGQSCGAVAMFLLAIAMIAMFRIRIEE